MPDMSSLKVFMLEHGNRGQASCSKRNALMGAWFQTTRDARYCHIHDAYRKLGIWRGVYAGIRMALCPLLDLEEALPMEGTLLDVGCGSGLLLQWLALGQKTGERRLIGLEVDSSRIELGRQVCMNLGIAERVDLSVKTFGEKNSPGGLAAVIFVDVLHHMDYDRQRSMIAHAFESLGDGGILLIKDVGTRPVLKYWYNYLFDAMTHVTHITQGKIGYYRSQSGWENLLREQGFHPSIIDIEHTDFAPHIMLSGKRIAPLPAER
jgi:2-polyprenyl-3-methyl-5-hydroxy-6-metoxy-1,4-benzoquinol methylase